MRVNNLFNWIFIINHCGGGWIGYQTTNISFYCFPLAHLSFSRSLFPSATFAPAWRNFNLSSRSFVIVIEYFHWIFLNRISKFSRSRRLFAAVSDTLHPRDFELSIFHEIFKLYWSHVLLGVLEKSGSFHRKKNHLKYVKRLFFYCAKLSGSFHPLFIPEKISTNFFLHGCFYIFSLNFYYLLIFIFILCSTFMGGQIFFRVLFRFLADKLSSQQQSKTVVKVHTQIIVVREVRGKHFLLRFLRFKRRRRTSVVNYIDWN